MLEGVYDAGDEHDDQDCKIEQTATLDMPCTAEENAEHRPSQHQSGEKVRPGDQPLCEIAPLDQVRSQVGDVGQQCGWVQRDGKCQQYGVQWIYEW